MTRHGLSWFFLHDSLLYSCKTMPALFSSCQEQKQHALTLGVLSSPLPVYVKAEVRDTQIFPLVPKTSTLYCTSRVNDRQHGLPASPSLLRIVWALSSTLWGSQGSPLHTCLSPPHHHSQPLPGLLSPADIQLTRDRASTPCTGFICLSKHVIHASLPSQRLSVSGSTVLSTRS